MQKITPAERYLEHCNKITGGEPEFYVEDSLIAGIPGVTTLIYKDFPRPGLITGITYGLSIVDHPIWENFRTELCICVKSSNTDWVKMAGYIANKQRGKCPFTNGQTFNFGKPVIPDSGKDAFLVYSPVILNDEEYQDINIGTDYKINIAGIYPIYSSELMLYKQIGLEEFWHKINFDLFDLNRKPIVI